jgi:hypothetical protein
MPSVGVKSTTRLGQSVSEQPREQFEEARRRRNLLVRVCLNSPVRDEMFIVRSRLPITLSPIRGDMSLLAELGMVSWALAINMTLLWG